MSDDSASITGKWPETEDPQYECHECAKKFYHKTNLSNHMRIHGLECNTCGKCFASQADFDEHLRVQCRDQKHFVCKECTRTFTQKDKLRIHLVTHLVAEPYACKSFPPKNQASTRLSDADSPVAGGYARKSFPRKKQDLTSKLSAVSTMELPASKRRYAYKSFKKKK